MNTPPIKQLFEVDRSFHILYQFFHNVIPIQPSERRGSLRGDKSFLSISPYPLCQELFSISGEIIPIGRHICTSFSHFILYCKYYTTGDAIGTGQLYDNSGGLDDPAHQHQHTIIEFVYVSDLPLRCLEAGFRCILVVDLLAINDVQSIDFRKQGFQSVHPGLIVRA